MGNKEIMQLTDRKRALIFINLVVSGIATSILSTAMTTALPNLVEYFGVSTDIGQRVTSGYSLALGVGFIPSAPSLDLSDRQCLWES